MDFRLLRILLFIIIFPVCVIGQKSNSRFENDTLYTSCGYKIYKGQVLHLAKGTDENGYFKFIKFNLRLGQFNTYILENSTISVKKIKGYTVTPYGNSYIQIIGIVTYKDGSKGGVDIKVNFDKAIGDSSNGKNEIIVPDEYRINGTTAEYLDKKNSVSDEIRKLYKLFQDSIITKEEFESQKAKLLKP